MTSQHNTEASGPPVRRRRALRRLAAGGLLAGLAVVGMATPAFAHNVLVGSQPANGAQVSTGPTRVELNFNAPVQNGPNQITVIGPSGGQWEQTVNATVDGNSVYTNVVPLGPAGKYTVGYRIISADGHPVQGETSFTLTTAGTGKPVSAANAVSDQTSSAPAGAPIWVWIVGAIIVLGIGLSLAVRLGRRTEDTRQ
jgi:hypothetical protein